LEQVYSRNAGMATAQDRRGIASQCSEWIELNKFAKVYKKEFNYFIK